jgi:hypothetical protein
MVQTHWTGDNFTSQAPPLDYPGTGRHMPLPRPWVITSHGLDAITRHETRSTEQNTASQTASSAVPYALRSTWAFVGRIIIVSISILGMTLGTSVSRDWPPPWWDGWIGGVRRGATDWSRFLNGPKNLT